MSVANMTAEELVSHLESVELLIPDSGRASICRDALREQRLRLGDALREQRLRLVEALELEDPERLAQVLATARRETIDWLGEDGDVELIPPADLRLTPWEKIEIWYLDSGARATAKQTIALLAEYQTTGAIRNGVFDDPAKWPSDPEGIERLCHEGPMPEEIGWDGFDERCAYWRVSAFRDGAGHPRDEHGRFMPKTDPCGDCAACLAFEAEEDQ